MKRTAKHLLFKILFLTTIVFLSSQMAFSQAKNENNIIGESLPQEVADEFNDRYSDAQDVTWKVSHLNYWYNDFVDDWYAQWYTGRKDVDYKFERANFYQATFVNSTGETCKALYTKFGFWHETRTKLSELPKTVSKGISKSLYSDWIQSEHKEVIEANAWPDKIYRLEVSKANRRHIIRLDEKGTIIQVKKLSELQ